MELFNFFLQFVQILFLVGTQLSLCLWTALQVAHRDTEKLSKQPIRYQHVARCAQSHSSNTSDAV